MQGLLSSLPPGLQGYVAAQQMNQGRDVQQIGLLNTLAQLQGSLSQQGMERELMPLKLQQLKLAVQRAQQNADMIGQLNGGGTNPAQALSAGAAQGDVGPTNTNAARINQGGMLKAPPLIQSMLLSGDPGMEKYAAAWLKQNEPLVGREGAPVLERDAQGNLRPTFVAPKSTEGMTYEYGPNGAPTQAVAIPGFDKIISDRARAQEQVKSEYDPLSVPTSTGANVMMPRSQFLQQTKPPSAGLPPDFAQRPPAEQAAIQQVVQGMNAGRPTSVSVPPPTNAVIGQSQTPADKVLSEGRARTTVEREAERPKATLGIATQLDDLKRLKALAGEIMKAPALSKSVGLVGAAPSLPGSDAANVDSLIDSLKAQISGMKLQAMRDASKTGGAVGQVTEREWPRLENMITALHKKMSPELFREKLSELVYEIGKAETNLNQAHQGQYGSAVETPPAAQQAKTWQNTYKSREEAMRDANNAIMRGADKAKVQQRLRELGVIQ
jgi:hypothetical protein